MACELDSQPCVSATEPGVFHLRVLRLLVHADVGAEIVIFVVIDGHDGLWRANEQENVNRGTGGFHRTAHAELIQQHLVWQAVLRGATLLGQRAVHVQRACVSSIQKRGVGSLGAIRYVFKNTEM